MKLSLTKSIFPSLLVALLVASGCGKDETKSGGGSSPSSSNNKPENTQSAAKSTEALNASSSTIRVIDLADRYQPQLKSGKKKIDGYNYRSDGGCKLAKDFADAIQAQDILDSTESFQKLKDVKSKKKQKLTMKYAARIKVVTAKLSAVCAKKGSKGSKALARRLILTAAEYRNSLHVSKPGKGKTVKKPKDGGPDSGSASIDEDSDEDSSDDDTVAMTDTSEDDDSSDEVDSES